MTKFIAISGKGGVGKTTVAINLASALHDLGKKVILLDANTETPHVGLHLGFPEVKVSLHEVLEGKNKVKDAIYLHPSGLKVIPSNISKHPLYNKPKSISSVLLDLIGKSSLVIIDLPPTFSETVLSALKSSDEAIIVATPENSSLIDTMKIMRVAEDLHCVIPGIVLNKAKPSEKIKGFEHLSRRIISTIPHDKNIPLSLSMKHPITYTHPHSHASREFKKLADILI